MNLTASLSGQGETERADVVDGSEDLHDGDSGHHDVERHTSDALNREDKLKHHSPFL